MCHKEAVSEAVVKADGWAVVFLVVTAAVAEVAVEQMEARDDSNICDGTKWQVAWPSSSSHWRLHCSRSTRSGWDGTKVHNCW